MNFPVNTIHSTILGTFKSLDMRKIFTIFLIIISPQVFSQTYPITSITISLPNNPNASTENWGVGTSLLTITANAKAINGRVDALVEESKILVTIKKNGAKICGSYTNTSAPAANFNSLTKVWSGGVAASLLGTPCTLSPGDYEICVQFFGTKNGAPTPLSSEKTKAFSIKGNEQQVYQAPQTILPTNGAILTKAQIMQPITLRWIPVIPKPSETVTYRVKVWQLMQGQSGTQAMLANQPVVNKDVNTITQTIITNLLSGPCVAPSICDFIWTVQALNQQGQPFGENDGKSAPSTFKSETENTPNLKSMTAGCSTISTKQFVAGDFIQLSDNFMMKLSANPTGNNDSLSGVGTITVLWLGNLDVKFKGIKINGNNKLCAGAVYSQTDSGQVYPTQWAVNAMYQTNIGDWTMTKVQSICDGIKAKKLLKPMVKATNQLDTTLNWTPLKMPLGYFKANDTTTSIGFTEVVFKPDHAEFEAIASLATKGIFKDVYNNGTEAIALHGSGIEFTDFGLSGVNGSLKLLQPMTFLYTNTGTESLKLTFNAEGAGHMGNGITFSSVNNEFWKYNFDADAELPKEWLIPADAAKTNVAINFQVETANWNDFILQGSLPACIIPNSNGVGIEAGAITYDHSYISNAAAMVFPAGYTGNTNSMFSGFYLKTFKLTLPDQLRSYADTTKNIQVGAENLIIDKNGITGKIFASNIINYPIANIGNLGASIDTVKISLVSNSITEAKILGKITLPLSSTNEIGNAINYSAMFASGAANSSIITFALLPGQDITSKFLGEGKVQIDQTSSLNLILSKSSTNKRNIQLDIDLNGKLYYPTGKIIDPGSIVPLDLDLSCNFENLGMHYVKNNQENFLFNTGHWAFASPQKKLAGFKFLITDVKPKILPISAGTEKQFLFKGGVEFVAKINIGTDNSKVKITGDTKISLTGAIESSKYTASTTTWPTTTGTTVSSNAQLQADLTHIALAQSQSVSNSSTNVNVVSANAKADYGFLTQLKPKYLGVRVENIHIDASLPAVAIKGEVEFYKNDVVYGNGFKGELQAKFTTPKVAIQAGAIFGNTKYIPNNIGAGFKYWMIQAQVNLPSPGLPFVTGLAFRGFGAGVYSRMNMTPPATFNPATANSSTFGGAIFTPDANVSIGFKAKAIIATSAKEETFNGSVALGAQFNTNGGMNFIQIDGLFNCGAKIGEEAKSFANGALAITYDFPLKKFSTNLLINFNKDPITTPAGPINSHFYIDGLKNEWAFTCGSPPNSLNTVRLFNKVNVTEYLMFGNKITAPTSFMQPTINGFASIGKALPAFAETAVNGESKSAKGFAFGVGVFTSAKNEKIISSGNKYSAGIKYDYAIGSEINASLMQYQNCPGFGEGWRIKSGIALFAKMDGKAFYDYKGSSISYYKEINLLSLGFGAYAYAEFPKPFYAEGSVSGYANVLNFINFNFTADFKTGEQCAGTSVEAPISTYAQEDAEESLNYTLINSIIAPGSNTNISRLPTFSALLNYPDNEEFDIQEQQSTGQMKIRTFKAVYTPVLTQDSLSSNTTPILNTNTPIVNTVGASNKIAGNNQTTVIKKTSATASSSLGLIASGYDALGAREFRLQKSGMQITPLKPNTSYKFLLTGRLQEKINNTWIAVKHPVSQAPIIRTKKIYFKTNADPVNTVVAQNQSAKPANSTVIKQK